MTVTLDTVFPKAPKWDGNFSVQYTLPAGSIGTLSLRGDYACRSRYYNDVADTPGLVQDAFDLVNARIALEPGNYCPDPGQQERLQVRARLS